ncbi:MAG: DUF1641 domain-containing protein [Deltaproteobacteria bacterium]|nr:DUF1641 domain-containing protein [Deltaproteobacteria bacterium]
MTNEELILERLDRIEAQLGPIANTAGGINELREDLIPLSGQAFRLLIRELEDVETSFQFEDLLILFKRMLRSANDIKFALDQMESIVDLVTTIEPLLKSAVPQVINYLDDLEQRGILRVMQAMLDVRAKIASAYTPEDIDQMGDGAVSLIGLTKKLSDPQATAFLEKIAELPTKIDLSGSKPIGPFGLLGALSSKEAKKGLGVLMELTKAMGDLNNGNSKTTGTESEPLA